ncbi:Heavy metal tolerance protein [Neolecta irregularis DAH-3]|uniref:Heavy metal tolerance protein n=1 Tax=Neolecta irregularis (strain DAH-3) TaxID=1198029 RepID=A0A1U7LUX3_NEOID|nr:Heavy metal tolerance protein [Neolecta irregularis DAH-3]|eukprot:OLL26444.1 Heavy metal tolerance protein [Neolecta irregularis DAH-3]
MLNLLGRPYIKLDHLASITSLQCSEYYSSRIAFSCAERMATVHYITPLLVFLTHIITSIIPPPSKEKLHIPAAPSIWPLTVLTVILLCTYISDGVFLVVQQTLHLAWQPEEDFVIYLIASIFVWGMVLLNMRDRKFNSHIDWDLLGSWIVALLGESLILILEFGVYQQTMNVWSILHLSSTLVRLSTLATLNLLYLLIRRRSLQRVFRYFKLKDTPLLANEAGYGAIETSQGSCDASGAGDSDAKNVSEKPFWDYKLFPYLWPQYDRRLQIHFVICIAIMMIERGMNVLGPYTLGNLTDKLMMLAVSPIKVIPWGALFLYLSVRFFQSGFLFTIRQTLWLSIEQYSTQMLATKSFEHVQSLGLDFHLSKKTGDVLRSLDHGESISSFISDLSFHMVPNLIDLVVAIAYFIIFYDPYYALVVIIVMVSWTYIFVGMVRKRKKERRRLVCLRRNEAAIRNDSVVNYETIKAFNGDQYENGRFNEAVSSTLKSEKIYYIMMYFIWIFEEGIFSSGRLICCAIFVYRIAQGQATVGDFVTLLTYLQQLERPMKFFANYYKSLQNQFIDAERLLELLNEIPTIADDPNAETLRVPNGEVAFENVSFGYTSLKSVLKNLSFRVPAGSESGAGKSSIFRLLFRFYDPTSGKIKIDGQDIRGVSLHSLRSHIGIVPQDTILFNDSIMFNLKYANRGATDSEIYAACQAAQIHQRILSFPEGYETSVGERGQKLSGGELQRIAIARAIIKDPYIILLDEATSAIDSNTELEVQSALKRLCAGRTTLVIAHRLSTIVNANLILYLRDGEIIESGDHRSLVEQDGIYASMWKKQAGTVPSQATKATNTTSMLEEEPDKQSAPAAPQPRNSKQRSSRVGVFRRMSRTLSYSDLEKTAQESQPRQSQNTASSSVPVLNKFKRTFTRRSNKGSDKIESPVEQNYLSPTDGQDGNMRENDPDTGV